MEFIERIKTATPVWFKRIIKLGIVLASAGTALLAADTTIPNFQLPAILFEAAQWMIVGGLVASAVAKTAKQDNV